MQFDHLRDKKYHISTLVNSNNFKKLEAELEKCEVVCANCHAERTFQRGVAQLVEHRSPKPGVVSSSLATPANLKPDCQVGLLNWLTPLALTRIITAHCSVSTRLVRAETVNLQPFYG